MKRSDLQKLPGEASPLVDVFECLSHPLTVNALLARFVDETEASYGLARPPVTPVLSVVEDRNGYVLLPHTDHATKVVTLLIYLPAGDGDAALGTEIYCLRDPDTPHTDTMDGTRISRDLVTRVTTVPYRPNHGLAFAPSRRSLHGVAEVRGATRRLLQFQLMTSARRN